MSLPLRDTIAIFDRKLAVHLGMRVCLAAFAVVVAAAAMPSAASARRFHPRQELNAELRVCLSSGPGQTGSAGDVSPDTVAAACTRIIDLNQFAGKNLAALLDHRGLAYAKKGDFGPAIADFTEVIRLVPDFAGVYFDRGLAYERQGDAKSALADYLEYRRLAPDGPGGAEAVARVQEKPAAATAPLGHSPAVPNAPSPGQESRGAAAQCAAAMEKDDKAQAALPCQAAADAGDTEAMNDLGILYIAGLGVPRDFGQALAWSRRGAMAGNADAMTTLGVIYMTGLGVAKDYRLAMTWYRRAADAGNHSAMYNVGLLYDQGLGVAKDLDQAKQWFSKAAAAGDATAKAELTNLPGGSGTQCFAAMQETNYTQAAQSCQTAANSGNVEAMTNVGLLYAQGLGVAVDYGLALQWLRRAANAGSATAMFDIGVAYRDGLGVAVDLDQAKQWFSKAAAGGDANAEAELANVQDALAQRKALPRNAPPR